MNRTALVAAIATTMLVAGCDGPREDAGEKADANAGVVSSEDTTVSGPAETARSAGSRGRQH